MFLPFHELWLLDWLESGWVFLTHLGRVTHICVTKLTIIGSDNGLSPGRRQAIIWTNAGILLIGALGTNVSEILTKIYTFPLKKMHLKMSSGKRRPSCLGLSVLMTSSVAHSDAVWWHRTGSTWWHQAITWTNADFFIKSCSVAFTWEQFQLNWVRSLRWGSLVTFCQVITKPGNNTAASSWPKPIAQDLSLQYVFRDYTFKITISPRGQWVNSVMSASVTGPCSARLGLPPLSAEKTRGSEWWRLLLQEFSGLGWGRKSSLDSHGE